MKISYSFTIKPPPPAPTGIVARRDAAEPAVMRARMRQLQDEMAAAMDRGDLTEIVDQLPIRHYWIPGGYAREMTIPAGVLVVGRVHKKPCFNVMTKGRLTVMTEDGIMDVVAPHFFVTGPGTQKIGLAHEEVVFTNIFVTDETDPDKILDELTVASYEEYLRLPGSTPLLPHE